MEKNRKLRKNKITVKISSGDDKTAGVDNTAVCMMKKVLFMSLFLL